MSDIKLLVEVTRDQQIEIEDLCTREGLSISKYFIGLHEADKLKRAARNEIKKELPVEDVAPELRESVEVDKEEENSGSDDNEGEQQKPKKYKKKKQD